MSLFVIEGFLTPEECAAWRQRCPVIPDKPWREMTWQERHVSLNGDPIVQKIAAFQREHFGMSSRCYDAQLQTFPNDSYWLPHVHTMPARKRGDFTTLVYLNDDYEGGELYGVNWPEPITKSSPTMIPGIGSVAFSIKPKAGMLALLDGMSIYHGVNLIKGNHRESMIFWYERTTFEDERRFSHLRWKAS